MSKILYIARHAKSSWKEKGLSDFDRPLNRRGRRDAPNMAAVLKSLEVSPELILSSPAERAKTTAESYHAAIGGILLYDTRIYEASPNTLLSLLKEHFMHTDRIMLVGHNPGLTLLNAALSDHPIANIPTAAVVGIRFDAEIAEGRGREIFYLFPKQYPWAR